MSPSSLPILPARQAHLSLVLGTASAPPKGQVVDLSPATPRPGDGPAQVLGPPSLILAYEETGLLLLGDLGSRT